MKISDYVSDLTRREGGAQQVTVAQVAEIVKKVNGDVGGILYVLIKMKGDWLAKAVLCFMAGVILTLVFLAGAAWADDMDGCVDEFKPKAVIRVGAAGQNMGYISTRRAS